MCLVEQSSNLPILESTKQNDFKANGFYLKLRKLLLKPARQLQFLIFQYSLQNLVQFFLINHITGMMTAYASSCIPFDP